MAKQKTSPVKLHPLLELSRAEHGMAEHLLAGLPFIALVPLKREGVEFARGDEVYLGNLQYDGTFLQPHPVTGEWLVTTPQAFAFAKYDGERRDYERDVLEPLRTRVAWAERDLGTADANVASHTAALKNARNEATKARNAKADAQKKLDKALAAVPSPPNM